MSNIFVFKGSNNTTIKKIKYWIDRKRKKKNNIQKKINKKNYKGPKIKKKFIIYEPNQ